MPNQATIQTTILDAKYKLATLANSNLNLILSGGLAVNEPFINYFNLNLQGLIYQNDVEDYTSDTTIILYDRLIGFIGMPAGVMVDPNFQNPGITIIVDSPIGGTAPMDIPYTAFDSATQQGDGGRYIYYNDALAGLNPMIQVAAPGLTALFSGTDYEIIPSGGFQLLPNGNLPFIYPGQIIRATGYEAA
jgi:hypothetical protein